MTFILFLKTAAEVELDVHFFEKSEPMTNACFSAFFRLFP